MQLWGGQLCRKTQLKSTTTGIELLKFFKQFYHASTILPHPFLCCFLSIVMLFILCFEILPSLLLSAYSERIAIFNESSQEIWSSRSDLQFETIARYGNSRADNFDHEELYASRSAAALTTELKQSRSESVVRNLYHLGEFPVAMRQNPVSVACSCLLGPADVPFVECDAMQFVATVRVQLVLPCVVGCSHRAS